MLDHVLASRRLTVAASAAIGVLLLSGCGGQDSNPPMANPTSVLRRKFVVEVV
jgi:hypothetical protein